jgi:hypothetical protein
MSQKAPAGGARAPTLRRNHRDEVEEVSRVVALNGQSIRQRSRDDDDDDAGQSWRAVAGLRNPYEEGGADDYFASLIPPSLATLVAQAQGEVSRLLVLSAVFDGISDQGEWEPVRGLPLPRFTMSPAEESVLEEIPDRLVPTPLQND